MKSEITLVFKDFLMDTPDGVHFELLIDNKPIDKKITNKQESTITYTLTARKLETTVRGPDNAALTTIESKPKYEVSLLIVSAAGNNKAIGKATLTAGNRLNLVAVSPWTKIQLSAQDTPSNDNFYSVEYGVKNNNNEIRTVKIAVHDIPRKILMKALSHRGSTDWAGPKEKESLPHPTLEKTTSFKKNTNKCNLFVYDVLTSVGISVALIEHGRLTWLPGNGSLSPPLAAEWGNPDKLLNSWKVETQPLPGDIGAYTANYSNASGHVGFVVAKGVCVSAGWLKVEVNDAGFRNFNGTASRGDHDFTVFRRYKHSKPQ
ncbi:CHAP domain-containing protein [Pseudomonas chlororaphis subsp. aurantiaca]|uniref:CHAP domain-containing protein n=1 Tax=Pseudomonas chlororaphis TaxID=587753 RepID=UPI00398AB067